MLPCYLIIHQHNIFLFSITQNFFWNPDMVLQKTCSGKREVSKRHAHCSFKTVILQVAHHVGYDDSVNHTTNFKMSIISRLIACKHISERQQLVPCHWLPQDVNCTEGLLDLPVSSERNKHYCTNWCLPAYDFQFDSSRLELYCRKKNHVTF